MHISHRPTQTLKLILWCKCQHYEQENLNGSLNTQPHASGDSFLTSYCRLRADKTHVKSRLKPSRTNLAFWKDTIWVRQGISYHVLSYSRSVTIEVVKWWRDIERFSPGVRKHASLKRAVMSRNDKVPSFLNVSSCEVKSLQSLKESQTFENLAYF